jgi:rfaE bifunctional protein kinase chain/domain
MTDLRWLHELISRCRSQRVLVVGDLMLDEFIWGKVSRISPEAPVPIIEVSDQSYYPGGAANVARNLREFTRGVSVMGVVGTDSPADHLRGLLHDNGIEIGAIQQLPGYQTIVKTRIIARQQHVVRVDRESASGPDPACHAGAIVQFQRMLPEIDAVIIEDYAKGFLNQAFVDEITALARKAGKIVTVDPNPRNDLRWHGVTAIKPNRAEAFHAAGLPLTDADGPAEEDTALLAAGERLLDKWETEMLLITLGERGMLLLRRSRPPAVLAPCSREVFDLSGAGDTAIALFTLALAAGSPAEEAAEVANHAASVVVGKLGTAILTPDELVASFEQSGH